MLIKCECVLYMYVCMREGGMDICRGVVCEGAWTYVGCGV